MNSTTKPDRNVDRRGFLRMDFAAGANMTCLLYGVAGARQNRPQRTSEQSTAPEQKSLAAIRQPNIIVLPAGMSAELTVKGFEIEPHVCYYHGRSVQE